MSTILITGAAGFVGSHLSQRLIERGENIVAIDNFNSYYKPELKRANIKAINLTAENYSGSFELYEGDVRDKALNREVCEVNKVDAIIHLAQNAGVRPSSEEPEFYVDVNINGMMNILEVMRELDMHKLVFISSSSVYGNNKKVPFSELDAVDNPISPYAATKKSCELFCYTYHALFNIDVACLRYFTVFGPRQRPDLAINKFTRLMLDNQDIPMFGDGSTARDYTYVDDIVNGTILSLDYVMNNNSVYEIFNLGGSNPISLKEMINVIGNTLEITPRILELPMQPGDVDITYSDYSRAKKILNYEPQVKFEEGIKYFVEW